MSPFIHVYRYQTIYFLFNSIFYAGQIKQVYQANISTIGIPQFFHIRILSFFWAFLGSIGDYTILYFFRKIKFRVEVLA